ncbi:MAG: orotate phosphoribosyltransferase [Candidatus Peribacteraceae bacterium]|nr:orotate phosphoribosyltransferase [Candidatus Peribacteraceae bacterium]
MISEEVAKILLDIKAVALNPEKPFRFVSGILSPIYCDNRLIMSYPEKRREIRDYFLETIEKNNLEFDIVAGVATSGIPHAAWIAEKLEKPMIYIRSSKKEHGKGKQIEGELKNGQRVLVVEDLISTGGSSVAAVKAVEDAGGEVVACLAIFTYNMEKANQKFKEADCNLIPLSNFETLIETASKNNYIKSGDKDKILEWNKNPQEWGNRMGFE